LPAMVVRKQRATATEEEATTTVDGG
jgi:hypothetical protein